MGRDAGWQSPLLLQSYVDAEDEAAACRICAVVGAAGHLRVIALIRGDSEEVAAGGEHAE